MGPRDSIWYFPGDPPVFETIATFAIVVLGGLVLVWGIVFLLTLPGRLRRYRRKLSISVLLLMVPVVVSLLIVALGISRRSFGEWAELKRLIQVYSQRVASAVEAGEDPRQLAALEMKLLSPTPTFKFKALREPVRLRLMKTIPPYVGVDFGEGANAVFDPVTMICTYAD